MNITIDCANIHSPQALHDALSRALAFPQWYGNNLDALFDCLTEICSETHLALTNWDPAEPWRCSFESVFTDAAAENNCFSFSLEYSAQQPTYNG